MQILLFGPAKDALDGQSSIEVAIDKDITVSELRLLVSAQFPALAHILSQSIFGVNNKLVPKATEATTNVIGPIVLVPPVSGG